VGHRAVGAFERDFEQEVVVDLPETPSAPLLALLG
jgi:hypothetical protein